MRQLLMVAGLLLLTSTAQSQQQPSSFERWRARDAAAPPPGLVEVPRRDYRYEGLAVGGLALGALGAWVGSRISGPCVTEAGVECDQGRLGAALAVGAAGAVVGGGLGFLIGRLSSKPAPPPEWSGAP